MSIRYFAPANGTLPDVIYTENQYGTEAAFYIEASEYPGYYFRVALAPNLKEGSSVQAGQQIGTVGDEEAWGEISVEVRISADEVRLLSFL